MRLHSFMHLRWLVVALCGIWLASAPMAYRAQADETDKKTIMTVDQPIQVRDKLLQPGTYVFRLINNPPDLHVVQIFNGDQTRLIDTILAIPNYRLQPTGDSRFAFWETPEGDAKALRAWFYPGDNFGQEFPRPKHFIQLASTAATPRVVYEPAPVAAQAAPPPQPVETQSAETQPATEAPPPQPEVAEAAPPPPLPASNPPQEPSAERAAPENLPTTGSAYPLIGLTGVFLLGLGGLLRLKRLA